MKPCLYLMPILMLTAFVMTPRVADAQTTSNPGPYHVAVGKPLTKMTDVLTTLSAQSGVPIIADDTVVDTIGVTTIDKLTVDEMLTALVPLGQGLTWQRVYLPQSTTVPDGVSLAAQVRTLKAIAATGLVIVDPATLGALSFSKTSDALTTNPAGMKAVYLVTNETVRAQRLANKKAADSKQKVAADTAAPVEHAVAGMQTAADDLAQMTPDQQRQALPQLFQQMLRMYQGIDPSIRDEMRQRFQQGRNQGGGAPGQ